MSTVTARPTGQPEPMRAGDYIPAGAPTLVTWQIKRLAPPSNLYVNVDDVLHVHAASSQTNEVVTVSYRFLRASDGKIMVGQFSVSPASDRSIATTTQPLAEGFLLTASCQAAVATTRGQTFARVHVHTAGLGTDKPGMALMADYVTTAMAPAFPGGRVLSPVEGPGWRRAFLVTQPLLGRDWSVAAPTNARWRVPSLFALFTASATVANRKPTLQVFNGALVVHQATVESFITASEAVQLNVSPTRFVPVAPATDLWLGIPADVVLLGGDSLTSLTNGMQAADQWSGIHIAVEEWLDNV